MKQLSADTQKLLRCPHCRGELAFSGTAYRCTECGGEYPLAHGVPVLIDEATSIFDVADFFTARETFFRRRGRLFTWIREHLPANVRNFHTRENYIRLRDELLRRGHARVLIAGGGVLGKQMDVLLDAPGLELVETDVAIGPRTQLIVDAHSIPFADGAFDAVIAQAVLEHVADPYRCVAEFHRVLKDDGLLYAETPFMQQVHGGAYDFTRFTHLGYLRLFRNFTRIDSGAVAGAGTALAWAFEYFLLSFSRSRPIRNALSGFSRVAVFFLKYFDAPVIDSDATLDAASSFYFYGKKSERTLTDRELLKFYRGGARP